MPHAGWSRRLFPLTVLSLAALLLASPTTADVKWRSGRADDAAPMAQPDLRAAVKRLAERRVVVHLDGPVDRLEREALASSGLRLLSYLGDNAWFASLERGANAARLTAAGMRRVDEIKTVDKLHPDLARGIVRPWSIVPPADPDTLKTDEESLKNGQPNPTVAVYVLFHSDVDGGRVARSIIEQHRGRVVSAMRSINGVVAHLPADSVAALAAEDEVMWVEPPLPALSAVNDSNRARVEADTVNQPPYGLDGSGVQVLVYDGGQVYAHGDFGTRLTVGASDTSGISDHSTHVAGTIGGDGSGSGGQYRGMAPGVDIISFGFEQEGGLVQGFLYTDPGDIEVDYTAAIATYGADIANNSIGTNTASNGFPCEWEGNYGATGALIDAIARGSLGDPFRIVWANGNERSTGTCGSTYVTTAPPACAKNHITVGAMNSNDDSVTYFTSWGPCDDGRLKPDISGPGCESGGDGGVTSTSSSGGYNSKCGTSMASPTVCGVSALLLQQYRQSFPERPDFRNATLKAILANSAVDLENTGPDFKTGYGSVRATPAADSIIEERFVEAEVAQGEVYAFIIIVDPEDTALKVTVAWDDPPGTPNVDPVLVNDLDLRVIGPDATVYYPWTLDPGNPADPAVRTQRDGTNNIEQVAVDTPAPGAYRVEVSGFNIAEGLTQTFSAAASPSLINCAPAGSLGTDRRRITCEDDLGMRVIDCDLNTDDGLVETTTVTVTSDSDPAGETVVLTETDPESAAFTGTVHASTADGPGVLLVAEGDGIVVTYIDADDGEGGINVPVTATVTVDCTPPEILSVAAVEINPRDAVIGVDLDEPGRVTIRYGTACTALGASAVSFALDAQHSVKLAPLADDTPYFYEVEAEDEAGNAVVFDNSGSCYTFTTPEIPDFFTEQFGAGIDLAGSSMTFTPDNPIDFYSACIEALAGALPTDPAGGTVLSLSDDQPQSVTLTGGAGVLLYGTSWDTIHVGPNGFVTFGSGDSTYTESLTQHFALPRVAAVFDDLNPSVGGTVSWKQLSDRVAFTWEGVPEYSTSNSNTFQIEMFFDGVIRLSWLQLDSSDAIVGLSEGNGLDPEFYESDLSAYGGCGPRPPYVSDLEVVTDVDTPVPVVLSGGDDGLPDPPGALVLRIVRLPAFGGLIDDGSGLPIDAVPYELVAGSSVTYVPVAGARGWDSFAYLADDGGTPPDGGESGVGTVGVTIGLPVALHEFLVDDTDPGWSMTGQWAFGQPTGGGSHNLDPTGGATGVNVLGYNLDGDYPDSMPEEYLTSTPLDLTGASGTVIEYQRWLGIESSSYDHAAFEISVDGSSWTTIWEHSGSSFGDSAWSLQSFDLSAAVDNQPAVWLRWVMGTTDGSVTYPGWNIDDIRLIGDPPDICFGPPAEASNLTFGSDLVSLSWDESAYLGGGKPVYDLLRSSDPADFVAAASCIESDGEDTEAEDSEPLPAGGLFCYLVRVENGCGVADGGRVLRACP